MSKQTWLDGQVTEDRSHGDAFANVRTTGFPVSYDRGVKSDWKACGATPLRVGFLPELDRDEWDSGDRGQGGDATKDIFGGCWQTVP